MKTRIVRLRNRVYTEAVVVNLLNTTILLAFTTATVVIGVPLFFPKRIKELFI